MKPNQDIRNHNIKPENDDEKKYIVYPSDLKYKKLRNINPEKAKWTTEVKNDFFTQDYDTFNHRIKECIANNYEFLDFSNMNLTNFPDLSNSDFSKYLSRVRYLFINNNKIKEIPTNLLKHYSNLKVFDISSNKITHIDYLPPYIEELVCSDNKIEYIITHDKLLRLDCSNNKLKQISSYSNLKDLICSENQINNISRYDNLIRLVCNENPITNISSQDKLSYLDCSYTKLNGSISNIRNLKFLICNNTRINNINNLENLESLEIINCDIKNIRYNPNLKQILFKDTQNFNISDKYKIKKQVIQKDLICLFFI